MTDESPEQTDPHLPQDAPPRPVWLQGLIGLLLGSGVLALLWYLFNRLL